MRGSYSNQSSENENARRRQIPYLPAVLALMARAVRPRFACGWMPRTCIGKVRPLAMAMALVLLAGGGAGHQSPASGSEIEAQVAVDKGVASPAPVADWADDIYELINDLLDILAEAKDRIENLGGEGPLESPDLSYVEADLADAESIIAQILDPFQPPYLTPLDAGSVDSSVQPALLSEYAYECELLAEEAWQAVNAVDPNDDEVIGTKLKTIESLLPGYRDEAGIE